MADHAHDDHGGDDHGHGHGGDEDDGRVTSPMQEFSTSQVGVGLAVLAVGLLVTFGIPLLAA
ncbi:DUF7550 family protein [Salinigranum sp. GCM10025319]|uniref:DUF7550 family protein n=1 Tax=Salinigranum sp. GCM10025319 TaxID=3252687 RepID=UPI0036204E98